MLGGNYNSYFVQRSYMFIRYSYLRNFNNFWLSISRYKLFRWNYVYIWCSKFYFKWISIFVILEAPLTLRNKSTNYVSCNFIHADWYHLNIIKDDIALIVISNFYYIKILLFHTYNCGGMRHTLRILRPAKVMLSSGWVDSLIYKVNLPWTVS